MEAERTKVMWVPRLRWQPEQSKQMKTPKRADAHVGFFAEQSKQVLFSRREQRRLRTVFESWAISEASAGAITVLQNGLPLKGISSGEGRETYGKQARGDGNWRGVLGRGRPCTIEWKETGSRALGYLMPVLCGARPGRKEAGKMSNEMG